MYLTRKESKKKMQESLEGVKRILDMIYQSQRGSIDFRNNDSYIEYFKLIGMEKDYDKTLYFKNVEENINQAEWIFQIGRPYEFSFENSTRFSLSETKFIKDALMQVNNSVAVKVLEELDFDDSFNPDSLQYYKIISATNLDKELYKEKGEMIYGYKRGQRFSLKDLEKAKSTAYQYDGKVVKVTEIFFK